MQYAIVDFAKNVDSLLHSTAIESDGWPAATDNNRLSTVVCRDIISEDLINLGLAMSNCLADNITKHWCDPYVFLRYGRLYLFLYCEHFGETRTE